MVIFNLKSDLCVYRENSKQQKSLKIYLSALILDQNKIFFVIFVLYPKQAWMIKTSSEATFPLSLEYSVSKKIENPEF